LTSCNNSETQKQTGDTKEAAFVETKVYEPSEGTTGKIIGDLGGCGYGTTSTENTITLYYPRQREINQINSILKYSGLSSNFKIFGADIDNAIAIVINNQRYILYDPKLLSYTDQQSGDYWSSMSILAHEIGHHLSGHTITNKGSNPNDELEADKFSGFVLYKLGASLSQSLAAMQTFGTTYETTTHPAKSRRLIAIEKGWNEANETRFNAAVPPPPEDIINPEGGRDNFGPRNLLDADSYQRIFIDGSIGTGLTNNLDGIILERPEYYHGEYVVLITKNKSGDTEGNLGTGDKAVINLYDTWDAVDFVGRAGLSWLDAIMVPGRKIRFSVAVEGTAPNVFFTSIKSLPADR
jgi:hypothetical protein